MQWWQNLKTRWGIQTDARMVKLWVVFAITGSTAAYIAKPLLANLGLDGLPLLVRIPLRLLLILPLYQVLLLAIGACAGEHRWYFWFLRKMWRLTHEGPPQKTSEHIKKA